MADAAELLGGHQLKMSAESASSLINVLATLAPADPADVAFDLLPKFFTEDAQADNDAARVVAELRTRLEELEKLRGTISHRWLSPKLLQP